MAKTKDKPAPAVRSERLLDASMRVHAVEVVEYILRGPGRKLVPKRIYSAAWEIQYALNRASNGRTDTRRDEKGKT